MTASKKDSLNKEDRLVQRTVIGFLSTPLGLLMVAGLIIAA